MVSKGVFAPCHFETKNSLPFFFAQYAKILIKFKKNCGILDKTGNKKVNDLRF